MNYRERHEKLFKTASENIELSWSDRFGLAPMFRFICPRHVNMPLQGTCLQLLEVIITPEDMTAIARYWLERHEGEAS